MVETKPYQMHIFKFHKKLNQGALLQVTRQLKPDLPFLLKKKKKARLTHLSLVVHNNSWEHLDEWSTLFRWFRRSSHAWVSTNQLPVCFWAVSKRFFSHMYACRQIFYIQVGSPLALRRSFSDCCGLLVKSGSPNPNELLQGSNYNREVSPIQTHLCHGWW